MEKQDSSSSGASDTTRNRYLSFAIGDENFGLEIDVVKEIINTFVITPVPHTPDYIMGIMNLRGDILPVIDVRHRFLMEPKEYDELTCIVVIEQKDGNIGLIVDNVNEVMHIPEENIAPPPLAKLNYANQFIKNLGRSESGITLLIETQKLLYDDPQSLQ